MFNKLYIGELKKLLRPKTLIALSIIMIATLLIFAISYNVIINELEDTTEEAVTAQETEDAQESLEALFSSGAYGKRVYSAEEMPDLIQGARQALNEAEASRNKNFLRSNLDPIYEAKSYLKALEYIKDHNVYGEEIEIYSSMAVFSSKSAENFMQAFFGLLLSIMGIYGIVIGAGSYAGEMKNGTLKMLFMRPITRNKLTTAKLLALLSMLTGLLIIGVVVSYLYGLIRFGASPSAKVLFVFNAMGAFIGTSGLGLVFNIFFGILQALAFCIFAFAMGTITKNKTFSLIVCLIVQLGLFSLIFSLLKMGRFLFSSASSLGSYIGVTYAIPAGGNFFIALPMFLGYLAIFILSTYIIFNKRDIA